ncbi:MAG TPA: substrate-binding domain-containing protein [Spirochaetota bacterium]|nr:substrate-binding domain-containing protein [Spirochaetota bacterium]
MIDRKNPTPIHYQLYLQLKKWFTTDFTPQDVLPTETDISQKYNVGRGTVRTALDTLVKDEIIIRFPGKGTFLNRNYFTRLKRFNIGIILSKIDLLQSENPDYTWNHTLEMLNGIIQESSRKNIFSELISEEVFHDDTNSLYDGFLIHPYLKDDLCDRVTKPYIKIRLEMDFLSGYELIAADVAHNKYHKIAYIGLTRGNRLNTIEKVLAKSSIKIPPENILECDGDIQDGYISAQKLLQKSPDTDCIICSTDFRALGVIQYLQQTGKKIPSDISVYGFDGEKISELTSPPLTTCTFDWKYPGRWAVSNIRNMLDKRETKDYNPPRGQLTIRATTRKLKQSDNISQHRQTSD